MDLTKIKPKLTENFPWNRVRGKVTSRKCKVIRLKTELGSSTERRKGSRRKKKKNHPFQIWYNCRGLKFPDAARCGLFFPLNNSAWKRTNEPGVSIEFYRETSSRKSRRNTKRADPVNANSLILCLENKNAMKYRGTASRVAPRAPSRYRGRRLREKAVSHCENYRSSIPRFVHGSLDNLKGCS